MKIYEKTSPLDDLIEKTLGALQGVSKTKTIFGEAIMFADGTTIVPISKVTIGFVVGGGEYADVSTRRVATHYPMSGGTGGAVMLFPVGFLVSTAKEVKYISTSNDKTYEKILELIVKATKNLSKKREKKDGDK